MLDETSGGTTQVAQEVLAMTLDFAPRLGHAEWADK